MTPPVLLTTPTPLPVDTDAPAKRNLPPFGAILAHPSTTGPGPSASFASAAGTGTGTSTSVSLMLECDAYDHGQSLDVRQWTGAPIRAIVPLPRRKLAAHSANANASHATQPRPQPFVTRVPHLWDDDDDSDDDVDADTGREEEDGDGDEEVVVVEGGLGRDVPPSSRYHCSYESITATEGLSAWSFEELRVECYAQSLVARGTRPPPVVQPSLAIPPAFIPRFVSRS